MSARVAITVEKVIIFLIYLLYRGQGLYFACSVGHLLTTIHKGAMGQPALSCAF